MREAASISHPVKINFAALIRSQKLEARVFVNNLNQITLERT
jgi:hypothetical protein